MQETSALYRELLADPNHTVQTHLAISGGCLVTEEGGAILFGGVRIPVDPEGMDGGCSHGWLQSLSTQQRLFEGVPIVGACPSAQIHAVMRRPLGHVPPMAKIRPFVRLTDGERYSEWVQKGAFYLDTREEQGTVTAIHGYDAMMLAERDCPVEGLDWPAIDGDVVARIAQELEVELDSRTVLDRGYRIEMPLGYSAREVLGYIAASYGGSFVITDQGRLRLMKLGGEI